MRGYIAPIIKTMERLRIGVIGTGSVVREIYQYLYFKSDYTPLIDVRAACDPNTDALEWFCKTYGVDRRYESYRSMIEHEDLDVVAINTPDSLHREPVIFALERGLDILLPKPTAENVKDVHAIIETLQTTGGFLGVDFHKREDPVVKEARARFQNGEYGRLQASVWYMLDRLLVADPNHSPRFFSSADFAEKNSPVSFLTSHMADTFITITSQKPVRVRAIGYKQKLPSLVPLSVDGFDLVDTEVVSEDGSVSHILTGWAVPNTAQSMTVQSGRLICSEGLIDLWSEHYGYREITSAGIEARNVLFRNFKSDGSVSGYGMSCPGHILAAIRRFRSGDMDNAEVGENLSPLNLGFYTTLVCECAHASLSQGTEIASGVISGTEIDAVSYLNKQIGAQAAQIYYAL